MTTPLFFIICIFCYFSVHSSDFGEPLSIWAVKKKSDSIKSSRHRQTRSLSPLLFSHTRKNVLYVVCVGKCFAKEVSIY